MSEIFSTVSGFFNRLRSHERKTFRRFLDLHEDSSQVDSKSVLLYDLLNENPNVEEEDAVNKIYGKSSDDQLSAFHKLLERFRDKMYESNFLDVNLYRSEINSPYFMGLMETKKLIGISYNIIARGVSEKEMLRILNRGIKLSLKFELYDELIVFLNLKFLLNSGFSKSVNPEELIAEMKVAQEKKNAINLGQLYLSRFIKHEQYKSSHNLSLLSEMKFACDELESAFNTTGLWNVYYCYCQLKLQYLHYTDDYSQAENLLYSLIKALLEQPALKQYTRIAEGYTNLAFTQTYLYKYKEAIENTRMAMSFPGLQPRDRNYYREAKSMLNIYLGNYNESAELLQEILDEGEVGNAVEEVSRRKYLLAVNKFLQGKFKESNRLLQDTKEIEGEKEGWNIGIRMLQIFLTLETEKIDLADQRIESLRKHIERTIKMKSVRKRDVVIFRLLRSLAMSGFNFKEVWEDRKKDFVLLRSNDPDYRWIPRSHELILFDQWFESKVRHRNYSPQFPTAND